MNELEQAIARAERAERELAELRAQTETPKTPKTPALPLATSTPINYDKHPRMKARDVFAEWMHERMM